MIETHIRRYHPDYDISPIVGIRVSADPAIRDAILWEYGLDPLLPFAIDPQRINDEITDFIRQRGTVASIRQALRWVGFPDARFVRLSSSTFEVDAGRKPTERELLAIRAALAVSVQARGTLKRIFNKDFEIKYG